jgi:hypothetical protein
MSRPACWRCPGGQRARQGLSADRDEQRVAQSTLAKHQIHGSAWGHEPPGYLASHREGVQDYGYSSFGELASDAATQDPNNCAPDLWTPTTRRPRATDGCPHGLLLRRKL